MTKLLYLIQQKGSNFGKYGICSQTNSTRILNGQTYYKNKIGILNVYRITKCKNYELYENYDNIITFIGKYKEKIKQVEEIYKIKLPYLHELNKYLIDEGGGTELFDIKGLPILNKFIKEELKLFRLNITELNQNEIDNIIEECKQKNYKNNINNDYIFDNIFGKKNIKITKLRNYQKTITDYILDYFKNNNNIYLNLATGGGKSFITFYILSILLPSIIIIFSPRKKINEQNSNDKYINMLGQKYDIYNFSKNKNLEIILKSLNKKIIVCCTQSSDKLLNKIINSNLQDIFIWFDEAHWGIENWTNQVNKKYWLESKDIRYRLFTSASPDENIVKSNSTYFGEYYKPYTVKNLIDENFLCKIIPYMYETNENNTNIFEYILKHFKQKNRKYGFSFHNRDRNALNLFKRHYEEYEKGKNNVKPFLLIDYSNLKSEINNIELDYNFTDINCFEEYENSIAYVVKKYDMGYDFKKLDFITFSDPKLSYKDIIQCIGRGTRLYNDKICNILLPIFISEDETEYDKIVNVLQYLINDIGLDFEKIFTKSSISENDEISSRNYDGTEKIKSIIIEKLNMIIKTTKQLNRLCLKFNINNENEYNRFKLNNEFYKLKKNIYDYKFFKWKIIVDPNSIKYYKTYKECKTAFETIIASINQNNSETDSDELIEELEDEGIPKYHEYDNKIPPYNKLKECYY